MISNFYVLNFRILVSDPAVALCPREDVASSWFVFAVYDAFRHVVFGTYTIIIGTNRARYQEKDKITIPAAVS